MTHPIIHPIGLGDDLVDRRCALCAAAHVFQPSVNALLGLI
jgi:hypothetical protein